MASLLQSIRDRARSLLGLAVEQPLFPHQETDPVKIWAYGVRYALVLVFRPSRGCPWIGF
jgi:hypothetical protein